MANILKMAKIHAIIGLLENKWTYRRIARELGVDRETVARYDRLRQDRESKPAIVAPRAFRDVHKEVNSYFSWDWIQTFSSSDKEERWRRHRLSGPTLPFQYEV